MKKFIQKIKNIWNIVDHVRYLNEKVEGLILKINSVTTVHADVHMKAASQIIVIGKYGNNDYVRCFSVRHESLKELIEILNRMEAGANVGRFDIRPDISIDVLYPKVRF